MVLGHRGSVTVPLPGSGRLVLGRAETADVRVDDSLASRSHCVLHLGARAELEDLGGVNGTSVGGRRIEPGTRVALKPGDSFEIGDTLCVLQGDTHTPGVPRAPSPPARIGGVVVEDPEMARLHGILEKIAPGAINVLLLGETGVGKEVFAERLHALSPRRGRALLRLNCAAIPETMLEAELFGHERGAFTGAVAARPGLLESADGGTVFLDEIGEMPPQLQARLLRVLEDRTVRRVGGREERVLDVRFVAATNRDPEAEVAAGRFRADLFFRLGGVRLVIPPLRARPTELLHLAALFLDRAARASGRPLPLALSSDAVAALRAWPWPGNLRELRNMMEQAALLTSGAIVTPEHLPGIPCVTPPVHDRPTAPLAGPPVLLQAAVDVAEREHIVQALAHSNGSQTEAARLLGISRRTLINKIEQYNLPRPRKGKAPKEGDGGER